MAVPTLFFSAGERKQININVQGKALAPNRGCQRRLSAPTNFKSVPDREHNNYAL